MCPCLCCAAVTKSAKGRLSSQRCAVRVTENPVRLDACSSSQAYPGPSSTKCTQISIASAPITGRCSGQNNCTGQHLGCWVQPWGGDASDSEVDPITTVSRLDGWVQSGPDCDTEPYSYLAPCPYAKCRTGRQTICIRCKDQVDQGRGLLLVPQVCTQGWLGLPAS
jgi:hypothetical protein